MEYVSSQTRWVQSIYSFSKSYTNPVIALLSILQLSIILYLPMEYFSSQVNEHLDLHYPFPRTWNFDSSLHVIYAQYFVFACILSVLLIFKNGSRPVTFTFASIHIVNIFYPFLRAISKYSTKETQPTIPFEYYFTIYFWIQWCISCYIVYYLQKRLDSQTKIGFIQVLFIPILLVLPYLLNLFYLNHLINYLIFGPEANLTKLDLYLYYILFFVSIIVSTIFWFNRYRGLDMKFNIHFLTLILTSNVLFVFGYLSNDFLLDSENYQIQRGKVIFQIKIVFLYVIIQGLVLYIQERKKIQIAPLRIHNSTMD